MEKIRCDIFTCLYFLEKQKAQKEKIQIDRKGKTDMKNRSTCLIIAMLLCFFCVLENAISESDALKYVSIQDKQISIAVPERFIVFERNDTILDKRLVGYGFTKSGLQEAMKQNSVFLYAFDPDLTYDINVVVTESDVVSSLDLFDDSFLLSILDGYEAMYESAGLKVIKQSIYQTSKGIKLFIHKSTVAIR